MSIFVPLRRRCLRAVHLVWVLCGSLLCGLLLCGLIVLPLNALASPSATFSLAEASRLALQNNPQLQVFQWRLKTLDAQRQTAALKPAYEIGLEAENLLGSDEFAGVDSAEWTLSLSSIIELGQQRHARVGVAQSRLALAQAEREARALDVLGELTQTFIRALALQEKLQVAQDAVELAQSSLELIRRRVERGAAPEAERLRAQAALTQARLHQRALAAELESRKLALSTLWGAGEVDFSTLAGDLYHLTQPADFQTLFDRVADSPALQVFASESRLRDAQLALIRSQSGTDIQWSLGVRRFEVNGAAALTAGVSVPLAAGRRNRGEVQAALAERQIVDYDRDVALLALHARLFAAWQTHQYSAAAARQMRSEVLPDLEQALEQTQRAYAQGRYNYADWVAAQRELLDARLALIDAATAALLNQALIEQLTAEPLAASASHSSLQDTP